MATGMNSKTRLQNIKVGVKTNFGRLATVFQICSMDADILSKILYHTKSILSRSSFWICELISTLFLGHLSIYLMTHFFLKLISKTFFCFMGARKRWAWFAKKCYPACKTKYIYEKWPPCIRRSCSVLVKTGPHNFPCSCNAHSRG